MEPEAILRLTFSLYVIASKAFGKDFLDAVHDFEGKLERGEVGDITPMYHFTTDGNINN